MGIKPDSTLARPHRCSAMPQTRNGASTIRPRAAITSLFAMQGSYKFWITCLLISGFLLLGQVRSLEGESAAMDSEQAAAMMTELEQTKEALASLQLRHQSELAAAQSELAAARAKRQGTNSRRLGSGVSTGMSAAALHIGPGQKCGANWASDFANKLSDTTDHGTCRALCKADTTCLAVSVSNEGCVKCKKSSIDWASGELTSSSTWTTYTKAPITCVSPKTYTINWRNTEAWCMSHSIDTKIKKENRSISQQKKIDSSTQRQQNTLNNWNAPFRKTGTTGTRIGTQSPTGTKEVALTFAGYSFDEGAGAGSCGCRASSFRMNSPSPNSCNHMFGPKYCPYKTPFEAGSIITGCRASKNDSPWSTTCFTKPQLTSWWG